MRVSRLRLGLMATALASAAALSGCWAAALQFAPAALQTTVAAASNIVGATRSSDPSPGVIELREDGSGSPEYREMRVAFTATDVRWAPVIDRDTSADGWRPAENFLQMDFSPPLPAALQGSRIIYLAYAPADPGARQDDDQLVRFNRSFGDPIGTFEWNGRTYQYSLPPTLPQLEFD